MYKGSAHCKLSSPILGHIHKPTSVPPIPSVLSPLRTFHFAPSTSYLPPESNNPPNVLNIIYTIPNRMPLLFHSPTPFDLDTTIVSLVLPSLPWSFQIAFDPSKGYVHKTQKSEMGDDDFISHWALTLGHTAPQSPSEGSDASSF
jgi:hypothetical protein